MKYYVEMDLESFARKHAWCCEYVTDCCDRLEAWDMLEEYLEYCEDLSETGVNDFLRFDVLEILEEYYFDGDTDKCNRFLMQDELDYGEFMEEEGEE